MNVLVSGGAGYIGSHTVLALVRGGHRVVALDDLSAGRREAVDASATLVVGDVRDGALVAEVVRAHRIESVVHFASRIQVGESVSNPRIYYRDNVVASLAFLDAVLDAGVRNFVFSSSAAVYGDPVATPIDESHPKVPKSPYGESKLVVEWALESYARAYGLRYAALRYFNAAGADAASGLGECHEPETHLIPLVLEAALGARPHVTVFGHDYDTPDGTCIRDYVHVLDLADAHVAALVHLAGGNPGGAFNLGSGTGHSVNEVLRAVETVTGKKVPVVRGERRPGDPPSLVASPRRAEETLAWRASRSSLERIVSDAFAWHTAGHASRASKAHVRG
ncbi:MAG: UDP-glucose 4-epimerase GalE [Polyangiaceae bacterium]